MDIKIAIVDDNKEGSYYLSEQLKHAEHITIVLMARNGNDFLQQMKTLPLQQHPCIVLMDVEMPGMNGIEAVGIGHLLYPDIKFLMLTIFDDDDKIFDAIRNGASGYLLKDEKTSKIIEYIQQLQEIGGAPMSPSIARKALSLLSRSPAGDLNTASRSGNVENLLSDREQDVLKLLVAGKDYKTIAATLFLSTHTIRKHIANIYQKLHISSKAQAINLANRQKWFE